MHVHRHALAALAIALAAAPAAHATCAFLELGPSAITRTGAKLPADGGILVGVGASTSHKPVAGDPSQAKLKATAGGKAVPMIMASLAPGLTVYRPEHAIVGAVAVAGADTPLTVTFAKDKGPALAAPVVTSVVSTESMSGGPRGGMESSELTVVAVKGVPDAAVALVVYRMKDEEHVPITYGNPAHDKAGATTIEVYREGGHCRGPVLEGQEFPAADLQVTLAWVDSTGRLSPLSAPIKITAGK